MEFVEDLKTLLLPRFSAALQEDADVIALSVLSGAHMTIFSKVMKLMKKEGLKNVLLTGGGIIPDKLVSVLCFDGSPITASFISNKINSHIKGNPIKSISVGE